MESTSPKSTRLRTGSDGASSGRDDSLAGKQQDRSPGPEKMQEKPGSGSGPADAAGGGNFECNICLDTPNDPVVTLCGHLFCWACLYRWLHSHASSNECPVCKAGVEEDKVVPLYGRGKASSDPRKKPVPGVEVPNRPSGQRAEPTRHAPNPEPAFGFFPGLGGSFASAQIGGFTVSAGFGLFPALFGWQFHANPGFHHGGIPAAFGSVQNQRGRGGVVEEQNAFLSKLLFALGICVMMAIIFS